MNEVRSAPARVPWTTPEIRLVGTLPEIVAGGGGKLTVMVDGDGRKPRHLR
jgi:hypothetical protein